MLSVAKHDRADLSGDEELSSSFETCLNNIIRHTDGRSRDIYGAWGWGKTHMNFLISIIAATAVYEL